MEVTWFHSKIIIIKCESVILPGKRMKFQIQIPLICFAVHFNGINLTYRRTRNNFRLRHCHWLRGSVIF